MAGFLSVQVLGTLLTFTEGLADDGNLDSVYLKPVDDSKLADIYVSKFIMTNEPF
jgi:hypothetical protein